jgi:peroxiredoxin
MENLMIKKISVFVLTLLGTIVFVSCKDNLSKQFTIQGTIKNNVAKVVYLEEVPAETMQPLLVDSAKIGSDGKFTLKTAKKEPLVYNLRLDKNIYPVVAVINDADHIEVDIEMSKENTEFPDKYEVKGSPASERMKNFMITFNKDLQQIFYKAVYLDSLQNNGAADSVIFSVMAEQKELTEKVKSFSLSSFANANDPALLLFEVGYYQSTANGAGYGLTPLDNEQVKSILDKGVAQFPSHNGLVAIHKTVKQQVEAEAAKSLLGKQAPDFTLPDVNGKDVSLSSLRGKYVLIDFWASWCGPCRDENPNVVRAYQQFKDKNFTILGVSLDRPGQKDKWLKAIKEDGLAWTHVSDLKFWESSVVPLYHLEGIPHNVLLDPDGKVIAENLRGRALVNKLSEVLH